MISQPNDSAAIPTAQVNGRLLIELRNGKVTLYPCTNSDEETCQLLDALLNHVVEAIRKNRQ